MGGRGASELRDIKGKLRVDCKCMLEEERVTMDGL
jgi:hypothetical protein